MRYNWTFDKITEPGYYEVFYDSAHYLSGTDQEIVLVYYPYGDKNYPLQFNTTDGEMHDADSVLVRTIHSYKLTYRPELSEEEIHNREEVCFED
ncbi:MAG: hypothetical protein DRI98_12355 [Bacteroidetes bacterium]|nr:MAG: hypothetical protein DRI98_12355 [Bacteroidota bacterium]